MKTLFLKSNLLHIRLKEGEYEVSNPEIVGKFGVRILSESFILRYPLLTKEGYILLEGNDEAEWPGKVELIKQYRYKGSFVWKIHEWESVPENDEFEYRFVARLLPVEEKKDDSDPGVGHYYNTAHSYTESAYKEGERCPACGYSIEDARINMDHHLCKNKDFFKTNTVESSEPREKLKKGDAGFKWFTCPSCDGRGSVPQDSAPSESQHLDKLVALREFIESKINRFVYWDEENKKWFESDQKAASESQEEIWHSWEEGAILGKEVDVMLYDDSVLNNCIPQADSDFYYKPFNLYISFEYIKKWRYSFENLYD